MGYESRRGGRSQEAKVSPHGNAQHPCSAAPHSTDWGQVVSIDSTGWQAVKSCSCGAGDPLSPCGGWLAGIQVYAKRQVLRVSHS